MAKLPRILARIFGSGAGTDQIAKFGSLAAGSPDFTTSASQAQSLSNWLTGWFGAVITGNAPAIEDMNAVHFVLAYQIAYQMQAGVPEWDADTVYYLGSLANVDGAIYLSLDDDNTGNSVTDPDFWRKVGGDIMTTLGDIIYAAADGNAARLAGNITTTRKVLTQIGSGAASAAPEWREFKAPTVQKFTAGSGTYTTPDGVMYLRVRAIGGGGGGGGSSLNTNRNAGDGGAGGNTTFGTSLIVASGGAGGGGGTLTGGGAGGAATLGTGPIGVAIAGGYGGAQNLNGVNQVYEAGGSGGSSALGGAGAGGSIGGAGIAAIANSGSGGGGGSSTSNANGGVSGAGGGAGGFVDAIINAPSATYAYAVGAAGTAGSAGSSNVAGAAGAAGLIEVTEYYQ